MTAAARMTTTIPPKMRCRRWRLFHVATGDGRRSPMNERICFRPLCAEQFRQSMPQMRINTRHGPPFLLLANAWEKRRVPTGVAAGVVLRPDLRVVGLRAVAGAG